MTLIETGRLALRRLAPADAPFVLELLNDPGWLRFIGDRGVRTVEQAAGYIASGPASMYERYGYGLYLVELKAGGEPVGICGLVKRDYLEEPDLGFALLTRYQGQGYAFEAAEGVLRYAGASLGLARVAAITTPDNRRSARLLERLGLRFERMVANPATGEELRLFACALHPDGARGA